MNIPKVRVWSAVLFFSLAVLCVLWAADNGNPSNQASDNCDFDYYACVDGCSARQAKDGADVDWWKSCVDECGKIH